MKKVSNLLILIFSVLLIININKLFFDTSRSPEYLFKKMSVSFPENRSVPVKYVYIILVDGLRYDSMHKNMEYTKSLINEGKACLLKARFDGPSNSRPGYARIFTGSTTAKNGVWSNYQEERCKILSIFEIAKHNGLSTGACAYYWVGQLFNNKVIQDRMHCERNENVQYSYFYSSDEELDNHIYDNGMLIVDKYKPNLFLMHFMESDIAGHRFGGLSAQYSNCVRKTDKLIEKFFSKVDMHNSLVMIISDHGHTDEGGHGGRSSQEIEVPVIISGDLIESVVHNKIIYVEDIAPTVCMLLGVPFSPYMKGNPIEFTFKANF